ncbi:MAG: alpha/beta-hydrolase family protein [Acidimicrobiia bacterium]
MTLAAAVRRSVQWANPVTGSPAASIETVAFLESFGPSLMPHTSTQQGVVAGLSVLAARGTMAVVVTLTSAIVNEDDPLTHQLGMRGLLGLVGGSFAGLPVREGESLKRAGARTAGRLLRTGAMGGALYDIGRWVQRRYPAATVTRPLLVSAAATTGVLVWAKNRLDERERDIERWPIPQANEFLPGVAVGYAVTGIGTLGAKGFLWSRAGWMSFMGDSFLRRRLAGVANAAMWAAGLAFLYNSGVGYIGRANEKIEPGYAQIPPSPFVSGSSASLSPFIDLGQQGRRFVTDVLTPDFINATMGETGAIHPIRVFIGYNSEPLYPTGRAEMALDEMERAGAFEREYLLLVSPTGTGWVDQTMIESAELFTRGDIASVCIQYGKFPSFLSVQKVALGRSQFRLLLWGVKQRLEGIPERDRPKVLVFGESLGAWTSSDVVMFNGIDGFDHYGIDKALWVGLPWLAKWSRSGMTRGASDLVPVGTVGVFDHPDEYEAIGAEARKALRAVVLSHDNDPIAVMGPDLAIQEPEWLRGERGRGVPPSMRWSPIVTFISVLLDAANAMVTVPGHFGSFGHDYRADMARFVLGGLDLPHATESQVVRVESALVALEMERSERINAESIDAAPPPPSQISHGNRVISGVPLRGKRAPRSGVIRDLLKRTGVPVGDVQ